LFDTIIILMVLHFGDALDRDSSVLVEYDAEKLLEGDSMTIKISEKILF